MIKEPRMQLNHLLVRRGGEAADGVVNSPNALSKLDHPVRPIF